MATPEDDPPLADGAQEEEEDLGVTAGAEHGDEGGEDSDEYDEEYDDGEGGEDEEDDEDAQPGEQSGLTALLLGNPNDAKEEEEEEDEEEDDDEEYVEEQAPAPGPASSKKRGIEEVAPEDEAETNGDSKKVKA